jgi:hypothetical protein
MVVSIFSISSIFGLVKTTESFEDFWAMMMDDGRSDGTADLNFVFSGIRSGIVFVRVEDRSLKFAV